MERRTGELQLLRLSGLAALIVGDLLAVWETTPHLTNFHIGVFIELPRARRVLNIRNQAMSMLLQKNTGNLMDHEISI